MAAQPEPTRWMTAREAACHVVLARAERQALNDAKARRKLTAFMDTKDEAMDEIMMRLHTTHNARVVVYAIPRGDKVVRYHRMRRARRKHIKAVLSALGFFVVDPSKRTQNPMPLIIEVRSPACYALDAHADAREQFAARASLHIKDRITWVTAARVAARVFTTPTEHAQAHATTTWIDAVMRIIAKSDDATTRNFVCGLSAKSAPSNTVPRRWTDLYPTVRVNIKRILTTLGYRVVERAATHGEQGVAVQIRSKSRDNATAATEDVASICARLQRKRCRESDAAGSAEDAAAPSGARSNECVVCMDRLANVYLRGCCHLCMCEPCSESWETSCPLCRKRYRRGSEFINGAVLIKFDTVPRLDAPSGNE